MQNTINLNKIHFHLSNIKIVLTILFVNFTQKTSNNLKNLINQLNLFYSNT